MWRPTKFALLVLGVAVVHFPLMLMSFFSAVAVEIVKTPWWARPLARIWVLLGFPASLIVGNWTPSLMELPNGVMLAVAVGTSLLWGVTLTLLWRWFRSRRRRPT